MYLVRRPLFVLPAVLAWIATILLPLLHAPMQLAPATEGPAWCAAAHGPALDASLAELPADIRVALTGDDATAAAAAECERACAVALTLAGGAEPASLLPTDTGSRRVASEATPAFPAATDLRPPPRGPPTLA